MRSGGRNQSRRYVLGVLLICINIWVLVQLCNFVLVKKHEDWREIPRQNQKFQNSWNKSKREFWESLKPQVQCKERYLHRWGHHGDGGKWVCTHGKYELQKENKFCTVFSFGVFDDSSFEADILQNTKCKIYAFDPSVKSIGYPLSPENPRVVFQQLAVGGGNNSTMKTLKTLMKEVNVSWVEIVKMDIEGGEFDTLSNIMDDFPIVPVGQLLVEFHFDGDKFRSPNSPSDLDAYFIPIFEGLQSRGLSIFKKEVNIADYCWEFSFINVNVHSPLIQ